MKAMGEKGNPDLGKMCRLCLTSGVPLINIFPVDPRDSDQNAHLSIPMRIMTCATLEVTPFDGLPKAICAECRFQLEKSYYFRKRSQASDSKLRKHIRLLNLGKKSNVFCQTSEEDMEDELEFEDSKKFIQNIEDKKEQEKKDAWREKVTSFKKDFKEKVRSELIEELQESLRDECVKKAKLELRQEMERECREMELKKLLKELQNFLTEKNQKESKTENNSSQLLSSYIKQKSTSKNSSSSSNDGQLFDMYSDGQELVTDATMMPDHNQANDKEENCNSIKSDIESDVGYYILDSDEHHNDNDDELMDMETEEDVEQLQSDAEKEYSTTKADNNPTIYQIEKNEEIHLHKKDKYMNTEMPGVVVFNIEEAMEDGNAMVEIVNIEKNFDLLKESDGLTQNGDIEEEQMKEAASAESNTLTAIPVMTTGRTTDTPKTFKCTDCPMTFSTYNSLLRHMRTHAKMEEKGVSYQCPDCKIFVSCNSALKRHMLIHTGQRPFPCNICNKSFVQREILKRHMITHSGERPYKCTDCDRSFTQKSNLAQHINTNHTDKPKIQQHKCHLCPKRFNHHSGLSRHLATHSGIAFQCIECNRTFNDRSSVKRHVVHVHGTGSMQKTKTSEMTHQN